VPALEGRIWDRISGRPLEARVHVLVSSGEFRAPDDVLHKVGNGEPYFYCEERFTVEVPRGPADIVVERGTEYRPLRLSVDVPAQGTVTVDLPLERWTNLPEQGWYAGNTHVHYDETETRGLERLRLDPRVEDLPVFVASRLKRGNLAYALAYASNAFPIGRHPLSTPDHVIDIGEESRHNDEPWHTGLGHIMLINLQQIVEPVSRGLLVDDSSPDYPPLIDACDVTHAQGGVALWCHNAIGMEAPVAAILGRLDGVNLFDPFWMDPEYEIWYRLLDCGIQLPVSTGSDWFVCSSNRVYVDVGPDFSYGGWLDGLRAGRTFITNGPLLRLSVAGHGPGNEVLAPTRSSLPVAVEWSGAQPIDRIEIVRDGEVIAVADDLGGAPAGTFAASIPVDESRWLAARCWGRHRTSYGHTLWAHTSPVYLHPRPAAARAQAASAFFLDGIDAAQTWVRTKARFDDAGQRDRMLQLFDEGRARFARLSQG
jgi:hypothetical protein